MPFTAEKPQVHEARWWETMPDGRLHCYLCPRHCHIGEGQSGFCFIRKNEGGRLVQLGYGRPAAVAMDPIEKKPLNHFFPGHEDTFDGHCGLQHGLPVLPELRHLARRRQTRCSVGSSRPEDVVDLRGRTRRAQLGFHI